MATPLFLPKGMASTGYGLPEMCQRHGRESVARRKITFYSRVPSWSYLLLLIAILVFVIVASLTRKKIVATAWPVCDTCLESRRKLGIGMAVTAAVVVLSFVSRSPGLILLTLLVSFVVLVVLWSQRDWAAIQSADVTNDGQSLRLKHPWAGYEQLLPRTPPPVAPVPFDWSTVQPH